MAALAALLAMIAVVTAGYSGERPAAVTSSVSVLSPTLTAAPGVGAGVHLARSVPVRLQIAAIGVDTALMNLGLKADGTMEVPPRGFPAGWYTGAPTPGELGPAIIAGHVDMNGPGVFYDLRKVKPGSRVTVTRKDGSTPVFRVTRVQQFPKDQFPTKAVYGDIDHAGLRLITCGGPFNRQSGHYEDNVVAFADLLAPAR